MKKTLLRSLLALLLTALLFGAAAHAEEEPTLLTIYEGPKTMTTSADAAVKVNGYELFVYDIMVNHEHIWNANTIPTTTPVTYFDFEGRVKVEITMPGLAAIESAVVQPLSYGIVPEVKDNTVSFLITEPGQYTVVFNGSVNKALHIFANPLETDIPDPNDPDVLYIGPGEWVMDAIALSDGQTLYLSGGAVLHSILSVANVKNVTIRGRGMIDGSDYAAWNQPGSYARVPIDLNHSKNITVEGICIVNSNCWNVNSYSSKDVTIDNVKVISGRQNGDGFTFQSCTNHVVTNSFVRSWDDSLVIKNYSGSTKGITFKNMQVWTDLAQSMEIGYETDKGLTLDPEISDVLFE
ncbi:MAG: glycosyl hydrolase family 28 protein, partial [Clostridia bacterium]|nr:glycosyl hydrolase family 28 protein [Clostridia bacterium]